MKAKIPHRRGGYTLLELVVSMSIILVLVSIIAAAVSRAITRAVWTETTPHMQAVLNGFAQYAVDHNGHYPPAFFPTGGTDSASGEEVRGKGRWLDETIYGTVYPDKHEELSLEDAATRDDEDNTTGVLGSSNGMHLQQTVFEVPASVRINPREKNWYNHSYCLNKELITDQIRRNQPNPEFSPRRRALFPDDSATMLIVEATEGEMNSVGIDGWSQIEEASKRYNGKFVHVGYMDGTVERVKLRDFHRNGGDDDGSFFWHGVDRQAYERYSGGGSRRINY